MENGGVAGEYVNIRWNVSEECDGYFIEREEASGIYKRIAVRNDSEQCAYSERNISVGETYRYRIKCFRQADGVLYLGPEGLSETYTVPLDVPVITKLQYNSEKTKLQAEWKQVSGADWYEVFFKNQNGWQKIDTVRTNNYELSTEPDRQYTFRIRDTM